jgi:hypothetical protein
VNEKSLKRLLNAAMSQRRKMASGDGGGSGGNIKVVALAAAAKAPKSFVSLLGTYYVLCSSFFTCFVMVSLSPLSIYYCAPACL